jgi:hypothetical protein
MKLSKILYIIPALALLASCDNINEDDRLIEIDAVVPQRAVLLEEFTGQMCVNCPEAHAVIKQLKEQYGDAFIPVSIHAGVFGMSEKEYTDSLSQGLMTDDGDYYANMWSIKNYPQGVFNRNSGALGVNKWAASIVDELAKASDIDIELSASYNFVTNTVEIQTELKPIANIEGYLQLWITESNIISFQLNGSEYDENYVHDHVYRASVNTTSGEKVTLIENVFPTFSHSISVKPLWKPQNLSVVAFVYNNSGVLQAAETDVVYIGNPE